MAHFSPGAPLLFWLLMAHLHMVHHYYLVMAHHMYSAPLVSILAIADFLVVPRQIVELRKSAARTDALMALAQAKAYMPELDPVEMKGGFPEYNTNGTEFTETDYHHCLKEMRVLSTQVVEDLDLSIYQAAYYESNNRVTHPSTRPLT
jgi:hypothetical protein